MTRADPPRIPTHLRERQALASDPGRSVWVSANAGSGKTHVLTQRVIRLLLSGVAPARILCLTFTKAAAAQMATRVFETLSRWALLDDAALRMEILATGAPTPESGDLLRARRLFTRTIETPGGLKIQTIHAFCERLLHLFPFEANVPARFDVADERRTAEMLSLAKQAALADGKGSAAHAIVADLAGPTAIHPLLARAMALRAEARRIDPGEQKTLAERLGGDPKTSVESARRNMLSGGLPPTQWTAIADILDTGRTTDRRYATALRATAAILDIGEGHTLDAALASYLLIFFDKKNTPRRSLMTKDLRIAHPAACAALMAEQGRLAALRDTMRIAEAVERTQALVTLADQVLDRYTAAKAAQGLLDFDDLIDRTLTLLERSDARWVLHKLDAGIDHVLVDEAQDTSEAQWKILESLTGDFASGDTGRAARRSFFVVGDDKQSIFSFQGAAPSTFNRMQTAFARRFREGLMPFEEVKLTTSFRSVPGVLAAVDAIFAVPPHQDGLVRQGDVWPGHESLKANLPGLIEIWPDVGTIEPQDTVDWSIPLDTPAEHDPVNVVAERIARKIRSLIAPDSRERVHEGRSDVTRPIHAGDILVLVRTRGAFFESVIRALKHHEVPVAGADRLDVANHIAVMDLVAAGRTALLPADDLSLACLLKSPLFGLTDDDLIELAPSRSGTLFDALGKASVPAYRAAFATIKRWSAEATRGTPFTFYVALLGRDGGRRAMERRLGPEAHDAIDEFVRLALAHEHQATPSLHAFLTDVESLQSSIKRDMEGANGMVRVMTVHAAKGLEAKVVFLPDTCGVPDIRLEPTVFDLNKDSGRAPLIVWSPRKADDPDEVELARAEERKNSLREYRRLLYVALTRAEERLYIAGFYKKTAPPDDCWSAMVRRAFPHAEEVDAPWDEGCIRRIVSPGTLPPNAPESRDPPRQVSFPFIPAWLTRTIGTDESPIPLRPSRLRHERFDKTRRTAAAYGSAIHMLLQHLPNVPPHGRAKAAQAFLAARTTIPAPTQASLVAEALAVMELPALAPLFSPAAKAEVAVIGRLTDQNGLRREVRGTIDRLVETGDVVFCADFKTGAPIEPPPAHYLGQMALYRCVLAALWPTKRIAMALVWTKTSTIVALDEDQLDRTARALLASA